MSTDTAAKLARAQAKQQQASKPAPSDGGIMHYIDMVGQASDYILTHPISDLADSLSLLAGLVTGNGHAMAQSLIRMGGWTVANPVKTLQAWTQRQVAALQADDFRLQAYLTGLIGREVTRAEQLASLATAHERRRREAGDRAADRYARGQVAALHHLIEREAASAYRSGYQDRVTVIERLAGYLGRHNPVVSDLLGRVVSIVLDLAAVDDPPARLLAGFLIKHVIERLGLDRLGARALDDLLAPLLGTPRPHDLPGVIRDMSDRLGALEGQQAQFWADGGAEVEQAGKEWANITGPVADIAIIAWLAQAATDPQAWARELADVVEPVMTGAKDAMTALVREG